MRLSREDWRTIDNIETEMQHIFDTAKYIRMGGLAVPECCLPWRKGYARILMLKAKVRAIKKGTTE